MSISNVVIFGATGDLTRRMLFPSLYSLDRDGLLADGLKIVGTSRSALDDASFRQLARKAVTDRAIVIDDATWARFSDRLHYCNVDVSKSADFQTLATKLESLEGGGSHLFFLSLSPDNYVAVSERLRDAGLNTSGSRIVVEKPIGRNLESCRAINEALCRSFDETRIFRIDHYLGKETVQNILALRFANVLFEPLWNRSFIDHVTITVFETIGVEGRWEYYDNYGALRDMVQNHVLQLLCLIAMEPPSQLQADAVRDEKLKVIRSLRPIRGEEVISRTVRAQYSIGWSGSMLFPGYSEEVGGRVSNTETFVALRAEIGTWRWAGVPFILRTGKRMGKRLTEIRIQFRKLPHSPFEGQVDQEITPNRLTITLQPDEHVSLHLMNKWPGLNSSCMHMIPLALNLSLTDAFHAQQRRIAYEQLLLDALAGNQTLFVRADETEAAWTWIDEIIEGWKKNYAEPEHYQSGSDGPDVFARLLSPVNS
jgi:glucose-6-phosphate 1-dehydrogenase